MVCCCISGRFRKKHPQNFHPFPASIAAWRSVVDFEPNLMLSIDLSDLHGVLRSPLYDLPWDGSTCPT
jgi:hypothetical protein